MSTDTMVDRQSEEQNHDRKMDDASFEASTTHDIGYASEIRRMVENHLKEKSNDVKKNCASHEASASLDLGSYFRPDVTNSQPGQEFFDQALRLLLSYQHEEAYEHFLLCLEKAPNCAMAHALAAYCHGPNYNFRGEPYYEASFPRKKKGCEEYSTLYPNQLVANYHACCAVQKVKELKELNNQKEVICNDKTFPTNLVDDDNSKEIKDVEVIFIDAIMILNSEPGIKPSLAEKACGYPFAHAMQNLYRQYPNDAEVAYFFAESLMVLHAWQLFAYPSGTPLSSHIEVIKDVLENALNLHPQHAGLCHLYVHFCEMSPYPEKARPASDVLRAIFPDAGHLLHMPTHIDILVGDYDSCVRWNGAAIIADKRTMDWFPRTAGITSFYFGYIAHNYHMLIYGAILGAMEEKAMTVALELNSYIHEDLFVQNPKLLIYLESYGAMDIEILVRFGRWNKILSLELPQRPKMMLCRSATIHYAQAIAHANLGDIELAQASASKFEELRSLPEGQKRILHNNSIAAILDVNSLMIEGEIAYFDGQFDTAFEKLRDAIKLQDNLNFDEPWGKMQPIRHALGGLLLKRGIIEEAEEVYREDLRRLPKNPWSMKGLINVLRQKVGSSSQSSCCYFSDSSPKSAINLSETEREAVQDELKIIEKQFQEQRTSEWADYNVTHSCACCLDK